MRGLHKLSHAANTTQALRDYGRLLRLAQEVSLSNVIPFIRANAGWRTIDKAAKAGVEALLKAKPELREKLKEIYPGFVS